MFKDGIALYHVDRVVRETGKIVDNGFEEIYVNASVRDGSVASELMDLFVNETSYSDKFPFTSAGKHRYKETAEGQEIMCEIMERINEETRKEARREARKETRDEINALNIRLMDEKRYDDEIDKRVVSEETCIRQKNIPYLECPSNKYIDPDSLYLTYILIWLSTNRFTLLLLRDTTWQI